MKLSTIFWAIKKEIITLDEALVKLKALRPTAQKTGDGIRQKGSDSIVFQPSNKTGWQHAKRDRI